MILDQQQISDFDCLNTRIGQEGNFQRATTETDFRAVAESPIRTLATKLAM